MLMSASLIIAFMLLGFAAVIVEAFVPAGGIIGLLGVAAVITSIVFAFIESAGFGTGMLAVAIILGPVCLLLAFHFFPRSPVGKLLILKSSQEQAQGYTSFTPEKYLELKGKEGVAITTLRPSGMARIENAKYSVVTAGDMIATGEKIKVTAVEGSRIVVRKV